jgi:hypothetical protein
MEKRKIIILTIVSTLVSLVFILLSYYGIDRYLTLHVKSSENFIKEYSKLPKAAKNRVVISFSVTPDNINNLKPMINSILDQTVKVDQILLVVSNTNMKIPKYMSDVANMIPAGKDYGRGTKLIPTLLREKDCDTTIIALDSNVVYGKDFIETMVEESEKNPDTLLIDRKGYAMLVKPLCFGCDVIDRKKETFDDDWFLDKTTKNYYTVDYSENYKAAS